ncbi:MAG TPA: hypothetical protein VEM76_13645, partial [Anaeromyxobacteraceae bacterium]|nr:hypothetical protein [Anaeromyxobacteraceae bacterium]
MRTLRVATTSIAVALAVLQRQPLLRARQVPLGIAKRRKAMTGVAQQTGGDKTAIRPGSDQGADVRPFHVDDVPDAELTELRRRINATKWPERETVTDASQGVQLATI